MKTAIKYIDSAKMIHEQTLTCEIAAVSFKEVEIQNKVPDLKNYNLLIAEDDYFSFEILKHQLSETKATLFHANTGTEAIEIINTERIDILILDLQLPEMDGFEVLEQVRHNNKYLPVIAHTAFAYKKEIEKITKHGFCEFVLKPYSKEYLFKLLFKYIKHKNFRSLKS